MGIHKAMISMDDKHYQMLQELKMKTGMSYDDIFADMMDHYKGR